MTKILATLCVTGAMADGHEKIPVDALAGVLEAVPAEPQKVPMDAIMDAMFAAVAVEPVVNPAKGPCAPTSEAKTTCETCPHFYIPDAWHDCVTCHRDFETDDNEYGLMTLDTLHKMSIKSHPVVCHAGKSLLSTEKHLPEADAWWKGGFEQENGWDIKRKENGRDALHFTLKEKHACKTSNYVVREMRAFCGVPRQGAVKLNMAGVGNQFVSSTGHTEDSFKQVYRKVDNREDDLGLNGDLAKCLAGFAEETCEPIEPWDVKALVAMAVSDVEITDKKSMVPITTPKCNLEINMNEGISQGSCDYYLFPFTVVDGYTVQICTDCLVERDGVTMPLSRHADDSLGKKITSANVCSLPLHKFGAGNLTNYGRFQSQEKKVSHEWQKNKENQDKWYSMTRPADFAENMLPAGSSCFFSTRAYSASQCPHYQFEIPDCGRRLQIDLADLAGIVAGAAGAGDALGLAAGDAGIVDNYGMDNYGMGMGAGMACMSTKQICTSCFVTKDGVDEPLTKAADASAAKKISSDQVALKLKTPALYSAGKLLNTLPADSKCFLAKASYDCRECPHYRFEVDYDNRFCTSCYTEKNGVKEPLMKAEDAGSAKLITSEEVSASMKPFATCYAGLETEARLAEWRPETVKTECSTSVDADTCMDSVTFYNKKRSADTQEAFGSRCAHWRGDSCTQATIVSCNPTVLQVGSGAVVDVNGTVVKNLITIPEEDERGRKCEVGGLYAGVVETLANQIKQGASDKDGMVYKSKKDADEIRSECPKACGKCPAKITKSTSAGADTTSSGAAMPYFFVALVTAAICVFN